MANGKTKLLGAFQKFGKAVMTPIAVLPAAGLLLRLGQDDVLGIPAMAQAGDAVFGSLALLFAVGVAIGLAKNNNGVAALSAVVGYQIMMKSSAVIAGEKVDPGVLGGIVIGVIAAVLYNKFHEIQVPQFLGFFGGKRFVPIITSLAALALAFPIGWWWPTIQSGIDTFGNTVLGASAFGAAAYGIINRLLLPFGLHHILNAIVWWQVGSYTMPDGTVVTGDLGRFLNSPDPTAGHLVSGYYPILMVALPAACLAMILAAKKEKRAAVSGMLISIGFTAFLTGITEPIEFTFMFLAPILYVIHALLTGLSMAICYVLNIHLGFSFSAGAIDLALFGGKENASNIPLLLLICLIFGVLYFVIFYFAIKKFNLKTPGREDDDFEDSDDDGAPSVKGDLAAQAQAILTSIGGKENIDSIDACITRVRVTLKDGSYINEAELRKFGATGVMKMGSNNFQIVVGTIADPLVTQMKNLM
ncbi:MAG: PTS transporter subunit EIIC [Clostridium sp.]